MSSWKQAVQAQLLFAQNALAKGEELESESRALLQQKQCLNAAVLSLRESWLCWLNEWAELLEPKGKRERIESWKGFLRLHANAPTVEQVAANIAIGDSWVKGFIELESLTAYDWLDHLVQNEPDESPASFSSQNALSLVQVNVRPCSVLNGRDDLERMLTELKLHIEKLREQHSEW